MFNIYLIIYLLHYPLTTSYQFLNVHLILFVFLIVLHASSLYLLLYPYFLRAFLISFPIHLIIFLIPLLLNPLYLFYLLTHLPSCYIPPVIFISIPSFHNHLLPFLLLFSHTPLNPIFLYPQQI